MRDKVARVRSLLLEAAQRATDTPEIQARKDFALYEFNTQPVPVIAQTEQARAIREVSRIAGWYGWWGEVTRAMDDEQVVTLEGMSLDGLTQLHARMKRLEDCAQEGLDPPDAPPAR